MKFAKLFEFQAYTHEEWEEIASNIMEKVAEAIDHWCWNISPDPVIDCYSAHSDFDLYELADIFLGTSGITEEDLGLLRRVPKAIYDKYNSELQRRIDEVVKKLLEEYKKEYGKEYWEEEEY